MKDFKSIEIHELRRIANKEYGVKSVAKYRKPALVELLETMERHLAEAEAAKAKPATAKPKGKRCEVCETRPTSKAARNDGLGHMCAECYEFSGMENQHSDDDHDGVLELTADQTNFKNDIEAFRAWQQTVVNDMANCWVCHPELNKAAKEYVAPAGTSRKGMKMNVPVRADGATKAATVVERVTANTAASTEVKVIKGVTTLIIDFMDTRVTLVWDTRGGFDYPSSAVKTGAKVRKVRNVSAALSFIGA
jgi:hypothetical protein